MNLFGITAGPDGNIWFTETGSPKNIASINPTTASSRSISCSIAGE